MKRIYALIIISLVTIEVSKAQIKTYTTSGTEFIFSFADYKVNSESINTPLRFSCFLHLGNEYHVDLTKNLGFFTGYGLRNIGFSSTQGDSTYKRRNYYFGVPLAIKLGNLNDGTYLYAGGEAELALNYKEKLFISEKKIESAKFNVWFSDRTPLIMPSLFVGLNTKSGMNLKFKYYLKDFFNRNFTENGVKIYQNVDEAKIFYFSISWNVNHKEKETKVKTKETYNKQS
jgi:hypothetical protein